jgi:hypothetical protein
LSGLSDSGDFADFFKAGQHLLPVRDKSGLDAFPKPFRDFQLGRFLLG